jgi:hypothetical protein
MQTLAGANSAPAGQGLRRLPRPHLAAARWTALLLLVSLATLLVAGCQKQERPPAGAAPIWNKKNK